VAKPKFFAEWPCEFVSSALIWQWEILPNYVIVLTSLHLEDLRIFEKSAHGLQLTGRQIEKLVEKWMSHIGIGALSMKAKEAHFEFLPLEQEKTRFQ
jgi:hypothetical protein